VYSEGVFGGKDRGQGSVDAATSTSLLSLPQALSGLLDLALDLRWSTDPDLDALWERVDPEIWDRTGRPFTLLQNTSHSRLEALASDRTFKKMLNEALRAHAGRLSQRSWFEAHSGGSLESVAYFCMEFGVGETVPIYAGGLGILAGDHLKACSDLGVPVVGVGLLYQRGYFRQALSALGSQVEIYPFSDPAQMPVQPALDKEGDRLTVSLDLPQGEIVLRVWEARIGRVRLFLLDSNHPFNSPADRGLVGELYGSGTETRLQQEILLGVGGWRLLGRLGLDPEVCHINEGHAAFAALERARSFMSDRSVDFGRALTATRPGNIFTTHTPVGAGFDRFPPGLITRYLGDYASTLGLSTEQFLALGRTGDGDGSEPFTMAQLALNTCGAANGVSRLHGEVSRGLFSRSFPNVPLVEVPVGHVTNGVHMPSWLSGDAKRLWEDHFGVGFWHGDTGTRKPEKPLTDDALWGFRCRGRERLVRSVRRRVALRRGDPWRPYGEGETEGSLLDDSALTLGFARRFTAYKRCTLLLSDPDRLARILGSDQRPVQLVIAGKAHPSDDEGKEMIHAWAEFTRRPDVRRRTAFLVDYDMTIAAHLVQGVDVWVNNPRRPLEASGTSGMKVLANGGLNLSELDGWWAEAYSPEYGWAIGEGCDLPDGPERDREEAEQLYRLLEEEVVPLFYDRDADGLPRGWIERVRQSMEHLVPRFSASRMVAEYVSRLYLPGAEGYRRRVADGAGPAGQIESWKEAVGSRWADLAFGAVDVQQEGDSFVFAVEVSAGDLAGELRSGRVRVELYADPAPGSDLPMREPLECDGAVDGRLTFKGSVPATRPAGDYTPRMLPGDPSILGLLEMPLVTWGPRP